MSDALTLTVGGQVFAGWTSIDVATGIDAVASSFRIGVTERWPGHPERWTIDAGAACVVAIGGEAVITGYIDKLDGRLERDSHQITVSGRSRSADLVDCSALNVPGSWSNRSLEQIAGEIAAPFGIKIAAEASTAPAFKKFALQQGESAWDAIERMLRQRGLLGVTDAAGDVRIVSPAPGAATIAIAEGREPLAIAGTHDVADRFSRYVAKGQAAGDDTASGAVVAGPKGEASDPAVGRYRPLLVLAEDQATVASLGVRAQWEATTRAAKAQDVTVTLPGWRQPDGALWQAMQHVRVTAPSAWIDDVLMVVSVGYRLDERGRTVDLKLGRPEAYTQLPIPDDAKASSLEKQRPAAKIGGRR